MALKLTNRALESFIPFNVPANEDRLKEVARKDLGETEERKEECLKQLRRLIKDHNLACVTTDNFLLRFLRTKKFQVQRSFESLKTYSKQRVEIHNGLLKLKPQMLRKILRRNVFGILPYRDAEERLIIFSISGVWNPDICSFEELIIVSILLMNYVAEKQSSQITGVSIINDSKCTPLAHMPYVLRHINAIKTIYFGGFPARYKSAHFLNESKVLKHFLRLIDVFIEKDKKDRMKFHGESREELFQQFPPTILPDQFGGNLGPLSNEHLIEEMENYLKKMKDQQQYFVKQNEK